MGQTDKKTVFYKKNLQIVCFVFGRNEQLPLSLFFDVPKGAFAHAVSACRKRSALHFDNTYLGLD